VEGRFPLQIPCTNKELLLLPVHATPAPNSRPSTSQFLDPRCTVDYTGVWERRIEYPAVPATTSPQSSA
jgi:hypothetical protein